MFELHILFKSLPCLTVMLLLSVECTGNPEKHNHAWDLLIFTQSWPITACLHYEESLARSQPHDCSLPTSQNSWTIHGIWPTKIHTIGPAFCNSSIKFNEAELDPIKSELLVDWPNIEGGKGSNSLWKHEWLKHGTCAVVLDALSDELKYFSKGLELFEKYNMTSILNRNAIVPSNSEEVHVADVYNAVQKALGKNPHINCMTEKKTKKAYLFEVRICFDKNFELTDCDGIKRMRRHAKNGRSNEVLTNCPLDDTMIYPSRVPEIDFDDSPPSSTWDRMWYKKFLINTLQTVQFLQWLTL